MACVKRSSSKSVHAAAVPSILSTSAPPDLFRMPLPSAPIPRPSLPLLEPPEFSLPPSPPSAKQQQVPFVGCYSSSCPPISFLQARFAPTFESVGEASPAESAEDAASVAARARSQSVTVLAFMKESGDSPTNQCATAFDSLSPFHEKAVRARDHPPHDVEAELQFSMSLGPEDPSPLLNSPRNLASQQFY